MSTASDRIARWLLRMLSPMQIHRISLPLLVVLLAPADLTAAAPGVPKWPVTPQQDIVESYQGNVVHDPYRWLEPADAAPVQQWIDAQNAYAETVMSGFADHGAIATRAQQLALTSTERSNPEIAGGLLFYLRE